MKKGTIFLIHLDEWGSWVLLTFILSLTLIFFSLFMLKRPEVYSDLLSYCFTLMAVSFYVFDHHVETTVDVAIPKIRKILTIVLAFLAAGSYFLLNLKPEVQSFIESNFIIICIVTILVVGLMATCLMYPLIKKQVEETKGRKEEEIHAKEREKFDRMKTQL
jgi:phosphotransferase system  glucose/maltose/N-acetylglucosamine-specific IIC component